MARALFCFKLFKTFKKKQAEDPPFGGPKLSFEFEKPSQFDGAREFGIRDQPTRGSRDREQQLVRIAGRQVPVHARGQHAEIPWTP